jgi:hypothetical protein
MRDSNTELCVASPWEQVEYRTAQTIPVKLAVLSLVFATGVFIGRVSFDSVSAEALFPLKAGAETAV